MQLYVSCIFLCLMANKFQIKKMASDKNHRPCLPLKPQEKKFKATI